MSVDATIATWKLGKEITAIQKLLLLSLADRAGESGECWPSIKRLIRDTNLDRKTIIENRQELFNKKLIIYTGEMKGRTKSVPVMRLTYVKNREGDLDLDSEELFTSPENGTALNLSSPKNGTGKQSRKRDIEPIIREPNNINKNNARASQESFECFYSLYPVKKSKERARVAWECQECHLEAEEILLKLQEQIEKDSTFIEGYAPNPDKYIHEERWKDEVHIRPLKKNSSSKSSPSYGPISPDFIREKLNNPFGIY